MPLGLTDLHAEARRAGPGIALEAPFGFAIWIAGQRAVGVAGALEQPSHEVAIQGRAVRPADQPVLRVIAEAGRGHAGILVQTVDGTGAVDAHMAGKAIGIVDAGPG